MTGRPRLFVHAGLHKTATTLVQTVLGRNRAALLEQGLFVPETAAPPGIGAHHNVAHQLVRDKRFRASRGDLAALTAELAARGGDALVSSEDFGALLWRPDGLAPLRDLAQRTGRDLVVVLTLREQASYTVSRYLQVMKRGYYPDIGTVLDTVLGPGLFPSPPEAMVSLDHAAVARNVLAQDAGLILRNYHALAGDPVADLLSALGRDAGPLERPGDDRVNAMRTEGTLPAYLSAQLGLRDRPARAVLERACAGLPLSFRLSAGALDRFADRFAEDRERLRRDHGIDLAPGRPAAAPQGQVPLDRAFSFDTRNAARDLLEGIVGRDVKTPPRHALLRFLGRRARLAWWHHRPASRTRRTRVISFTEGPT